MNYNKHENGFYHTAELDTEFVVNGLALQITVDTYRGRMVANIWAQREGYQDELIAQRPIAEGQTHLTYHLSPELCAEAWEVNNE